MVGQAFLPATGSERDAKGDRQECLSHWGVGLDAARQTFADQLQKLIRKFEGDKAHYLSKDYPEAQVRLDFINPFLKAVGWDVDNEQGLPRRLAL